MVSEAGLEPARPFSQSLAPQASASANSATPTWGWCESYSSTVFWNGQRQFEIFSLAPSLGRNEISQLGDYRPFTCTDTSCEDTFITQTNVGAFFLSDGGTGGPQALARSDLLCVTDRRSPELGCCRRLVARIRRRKLIGHRNRTVRALSGEWGSGDLKKHVNHPWEELAPSDFGDRGQEPIEKAPPSRGGWGKMACAARCWPRCPEVLLRARPRRP